MTVPVLAAFSKAHPTIRITVLTKKQFAPLFRDLQMVTVILADFTATHKGVYGLYKLSKQIRNTSVDAVADLHNVLRTKILSVFLLGLNFVQMDKGRSEKKALISGNLHVPLRTTTQRYADVFRRLGFDFDLDNPSFLLLPEHSAASYRRLQPFLQHHLS